MLSLLSKLLLMGLLVLSSYALIYMLPAEQVSYLSASFDKHNRLRSTRPPRVIFAGGSNLAFGLDSRLAEERLGRPAVNMGLAAGLGLRFQLDEVKPHLGPGDVVVVAPEYEQFSPMLNGERALADLLALTPESVDRLSSPRQYFVVLKNLPLHFQDKIYLRLVTAIRGAAPTSDIYRRDSFDQYGDVTAHLGRTPKTDWQAGFARDEFKPEPYAEAIAVLNGFNDYAESRGARVVIIFPCIPDLLDAEERQNLDGLYRRLKAEVRATIAAPPENYIYPPDCFYDTPYHLTERCRETRTLQLLTDLAATQQGR